MTGAQWSTSWMQPPVFVQPAPPTGAAAWFLGALTLLLGPPLLPLPLITAGCLAMTIVGLGIRKRGIEPGSTIGTRAANWGLTCLISVMLLIVVHVIVADNAERSTFSPRDIPLVMFVLLSLFHFVFCIVAGVKARSGKALSFCGVPFFKAR